MTYKNEPAYPIIVSDVENVNYSGLTVRELFAYGAWTAILGKYNLKTPEDQETVAKLAIELTDTFINELNK